MNALQLRTCVRMKQAVRDYFLSVRNTLDQTPLFQLLRCKSLIDNSCIRQFDLVDCSAAFRFCGEELAFPYDNLGKLHIVHVYLTSWRINEIARLPRTESL